MAAECHNSFLQLKLFMLFLRPVHHREPLLVGLITHFLSGPTFASSPLATGAGLLLMMLLCTRSVLPINTEQNGRSPGPSVWNLGHPVLHFYTPGVKMVNDGV